jgi:beta-glucanase (GH16 family)
VGGHADCSPALVRKLPWIALGWLLSFGCSPGSSSPSLSSPGGDTPSADLGAADAPAQGGDLPTGGNGPSADLGTPPPDLAPPSPWQLTWSDEFNGAAGAIDASKWNFDTGTGSNGWGNNELEYYTNRTDNVTLDGNGNLLLIARRESFGGAAYTSGRINSSGKFSQAYGRFEARIQIAQGQGIWPAFWILGANIGTAGWPGCGELDIQETVNAAPPTNHGSCHGPGYSGANPLTATYTLPAGALSDGYHLYALEWEPNVVRFYVDDHLYETRTPADVPAGSTWVYDHPFFVILNLAVGGNFPGPPNANTVFPATTKVDYVRVYKKR